MAADVRVNLVKLTVQTGATMVVIVLALFLPAGTFAWPAGWIFIALMFFLSIAESVWLIRFNPALMNERLSGLGRKDQEKWDKVLMSFVAVTFLGWFVVMGFDAVRFRWSHVPSWVQVVGGLIFVASFPIFHAAFRENSFLSPAVRVQTERAQTVVRTGPYGRVRHPLYAGFTVFVIGAALLLGSWWGLVGAIVLIVLVAIRAVGEERMLRERLPGYAEYMREVPYRFVPGVW